MILALRKIYGTDLEFTINVCGIDDPGVPFLDAMLWLDKRTQTIRTKTYEKPGNAHELTRECSNVPRHTVKGIACGCTRRLIIANDSYEHFVPPRANLFRRLMAKGWPWRTLTSIKNVPKYADRQQLIDSYIAEQQQKKRLFVEKYREMDFKCLKESTFSENEIICVKPEYQLCHDDLPKLSRLLHKCRQKLPYNMEKRTRLIVASKGVPKLWSKFPLNGL